MDVQEITTQPELDGFIKRMAHRSRAAVYDTIADRWVEDGDIDFDPKPHSQRELGEPHTLAALVNHTEEETSYGGGTIIEMKRYTDLLRVLPDKIVNNLEKARLERAGKGAMLRAGLGYVELLSSIIVDATAVGTSSAEAKLVPALLIPANYMAPGGIPGRTLRGQLRGRATTLTTAATMTLRNRIAATDIITGTVLQATGAITMDTTIQTNTQWEWEKHSVVRSVGATGTVFCQGDAMIAAQAATIANNTADFSGSAGSAAPAAVTYDTTAGQFWQITAQWSLATAYSIQTHLYMLEALN